MRSANRQFKQAMLTLLFVAGALIFFVGFINFFMWIEESDKKEASENCSRNAKLMDATDWKSDGFDCYVIKNDKIIEVVQ